MFEQEYLYVNMWEYDPTTDSWYNVQNGRFNITASDDSFDGVINQDIFPINIPYVSSNNEIITLEFWVPGDNSYKKYELTYLELSPCFSGDYFNVYLETP